MLAREQVWGVRRVIWLYLCAFTLNSVARGDHDVDVPYVRSKFEWDSVDDFNVWWSKVGGGGENPDASLIDSLWYQ